MTGVTQELPPTDLTVRFESINTGEGIEFRSDATDPEKLASVSDFSDKMNVGHESASVQLFRADERRYSMPRELQTMKIIGAGGKELSETRVQPIPRGTGKNLIQGVGWYAGFSDDGSYGMVYADADRAHWGDLTLARRSYLLLGSIDLGSISVSDLAWNLPNQALPAQVLAGTAYVAPAGCTVAKVGYNGTFASWPAGWRGSYVEAADDEGAAMPEGGALTFDGTDRTHTFGSARRYVEINGWSNGTASTPAAGANMQLARVTAYGPHGLTNIYASEVLKHFVGAACPTLTYTDDSIEDNTYEIGHLIAEPGEPPERLIGKIQAYHLWQIFVWGRTVHWRTPLLLDDYDYLLDFQYGDTFAPASQGQADDQPFNAVDVLYNSVTTGREEIVTSADSSSLADTSDANPCNIESINRTAVLNIGFPTTEADAVQIGSVYLAEKSLPTRAGTGTCGPWAKNRAGQWVSSAEIRSGDRVKYAHSPDIFTVYGKKYSPGAGGAARCDLQFEDAPSTTDGIMERMQSALSLVGVR